MLYTLRLITFLASLYAFSLTACSNAAAAGSASTGEEYVPSDSTATAANGEVTSLYATVDRLTIRAVPDTKAAALGSLDYGAVVASLGEETDFKEKITLGGKPRYASWQKIVYHQPGSKEELAGWVYGGGLSETKPAPLPAKPPKPAKTSAVDLRRELEAQEHAAPKKYLTVTKAYLDANRVSRGFLKGRRTEGYWLSGSIWCSASAAYYQDAVLQVTGISKTGTRIGSQQHVLYEVFVPNHATEFHLKIEGIKDAAQYDVIVTNAKPYVGEGMEFMQEY